MATVQIADIYEPLTFAQGIQAAQTERNAFIASGIVAASALLASNFAAGGTITEIPFFNPLATGEPNYSTDDPETLSTPANIAGGKQICRLSNRNKSWSTMNLAQELALADPVGAITGRIGHYWATDDQSRVIKSCVGILADNVANDSGDMLFSVATDAVGAITDAERISADVVIDAEQTLGDAMASVEVMAIHSVIYARLRKQNLIDFTPVNEQGQRFPIYLGKRLVIDDGCPVTVGTNRTTYTSILFGRGSILSAPGKVLVPSEMERVAASGNGGGEDIVHSRVANAFHPNGFSFLSASVAGQSATYAELATATNWNRTIARKAIPLAFLKTNG